MDSTKLQFLYVAAEGADDSGKSPYGPPTLPYVASLQAALDASMEDGERGIEVVRIETSDFVRRVQEEQGEEDPYVVWPYYRAQPSGTDEHPDVFSVMDGFPEDSVMNDVRKEGVRLGDKGFDYQRAEEHGIPIPETVLLENAERMDEGFNFSYPIVIKGYPSGRGLDVHLCDSLEEAKAAYESCTAKGLDVVAQEYVEHSHGRDLRVLVAGGEIVLMLGREGAPGEFKSNVSGGGKYIENPQLSDADMAVIQSVIDAFPIDVAGIDFLYTKDGGLVFNEINSAPGWSGLAKGMADALAVLIRQRFKLLNVLN
jgi:hypothetical protein